MEKVKWKVDGMTCSNCALTVHKYLENEGMNEVKVNLITGDISFDGNGELKKDKLIKGIHSLGYSVVSDDQEAEKKSFRFLDTHLKKFWFCLPFTLVLMLHMIPGLHIHWLMDPYVQLALATPVYIVGIHFFGRSAYHSLLNGLPNMNVLIALGASAAFFYSLTGTLMNLGEGYLFYETAASIFTLVLFGNYIEDASIRSTQKALNELARSQKVMANMIAFDDEHKEQIFPIENTQLRVGDLILIKSGEQVPMDCKIIWGEAEINEAIITGESIPVHKKQKDLLIGGSLLENGTVKAQVTAVGDETVLSGIINLVKQAQGEKPPVQKMADRISAIFVPVVLAIALITLAVNWYLLSAFTPALMRSIAVLVIACPCAMGLATPAAIAVGLGRGAKEGILFMNAGSLELFKDIKQVVFDKTGTLTTGEFNVAEYKYLSTDEQEFKRIAFSIEKFSNHPIAKSITREWKINDAIKWKSVEEIKGIGMKAIDTEGNIFYAGSFRVAEKMDVEKTHNIYLVKNENLLGWIDVKDEIREEAIGVIEYLHKKNIKTILLSGDRQEKCDILAKQLGIDTVYAEKKPEEKLSIITELTAHQPTIMVGDGINDAPALAKATIGISVSEASQIAMQSAQVVLMNKGLKNLPNAMGLGKHTYITIKQNLFWAFFYNIVAIPVAALGFLTPTFGALVMGLSDVVLAINSVRLFVKKVV